jgi:hypothetical protein
MLPLLMVIMPHLKQLETPWLMELGAMPDRLAFVDTGYVGGRVNASRATPVMGAPRQVALPVRAAS